MLNQQLKKRALHRAKILEGQMRGLAKAIEAERYCIDLLRHSLSIQRSLKSLDAFLLENHLRSHVVEQMRHKPDEQRAIRELLEIYILSNK